MKALKALLFLGIVGGSSLPAIAQDNIIDEVVWVVGDEPILKSDVEESRISSEMGGTPIQNPYCVIPEQLAIQKLFLHQADIDSLYAKDNEITQAVNRQESYYLNVYGSKERIEEYAKKSIKDLREMWKTQSRDRIRIDQMRSKIVDEVKVTPAEVREYFKTVPQDSLPIIPTEVEVQIITQTPTIPRSEIDRIENELREYARRVNSGESDFATLAMLYSQDGSARNGGELGYSGRGEWVPEFANVAFSLNDPKKVSKIVKTEYGYHILQFIGKRGDKVNVRHILLKPQMSQTEIDKSLVRLDSLANDIRTNEKHSFENMVAFNSDDKDTKKNYGLMSFYDSKTNARSSRIEMKNLQQDVAKVVDTMKVGEISRSFVMTNNNGQEVCAIVKLKSRIDSHRANMTEDFQAMKDIVLEKMQAKKVDEWIKEKQKTTYVRINPKWQDCTFQYPGWIKK